MTKRCSKCGIEKPLDQFNKHKGQKYGVYCQCKVCRKPSTKAYREAHREELAENQKAYYKAHQEESKAYQKELHIKRAELGLCVMCGKPALQAYWETSPDYIRTFLMCANCIQNRRLREYRYYSSHIFERRLYRRQRQARLREENRCVTCGRPLTEDDDGAQCRGCSCKRSRGGIKMEKLYKGGKNAITNQTVTK